MATSVPISRPATAQNTPGGVDALGQPTNSAAAAIPASGNLAFGTTVDSSTPTGRLDPDALNGLTLMNGMTAGYGVFDGHTENPPAYPGTYGGNPLWAPKRIGVMRNVPGTAVGTEQTQYSLYFIYNPNEIDVGFQMNTSQTPALYLYSGPNPATAPNFTNAQSVSWSLLFDRTYDMLYGDPNGGNPDLNRGVLRDTAALYNLLGTFGNSPSDANQGATPYATPIEVAFAQTDSGQLWGFTGFVTSVQITYGQFRWDMIPSRCSVDLQMTATYVAPQTPGGDASAAQQGPAPGAVPGAAGGALVTPGGALPNIPNISQNPLAGG